MSAWTKHPELVDRLGQYWASGMSSPYIAAALGHGLTPRAVRAKAATLGLGHRKTNGFVLPYQSGSGVSTRKEKTPPAKVATPQEGAPVPIGMVGDFPDRERSTCRFIHGEVGKGEWRLCGHSGYPWCAFHRDSFTTAATNRSNVNRDILRLSGINRVLG